MSVTATREVDRVMRQPRGRKDQENRQSVAIVAEMKRRSTETLRCVTGIARSVKIEWDDCITHPDKRSKNMNDGNFQNSLQAFARRRPFKPFAVELVSGDRFVVDHPE